MQHPKVSVVIPTYNRPKEILKSIDTVLKQTYAGEIEILIIDDSKESQQKNIGISFKKQNNRIINYIHNGKKEGAPKARNLGIKKSTGKYIAFLDDDDEWMPTKTEKQVDIMEKNSDVALVVCDSLDKRFGKERISRPPEKITHNIILNSFNLSSSSSYLVRRDPLIAEGCFDITLPSAQEYDIAIRLSRKHRVICVSETLMIQNETIGQISENWSRKIKGFIAIYNKHGKDYHKANITNHIKFLGMLGLFTMGFLIGNKIYSIVIPVKERYEG